MIARNRNLELQILAYISTFHTWVNIDPKFFYGKERQVYQTLKQQHDETGHIEPALLNGTHLSIVEEGENLAYPSNIEPVVNELKKQWQAQEAWKILIKSIKELERGKITGVGAIDTVKAEGLNIGAAIGPTEYDHVSDTLDFMKYIKESSTSKYEFKGISSGHRQLDLYLSGFQRGLTYVIGGLKKTGKSRFAIDLASNFAKNGHAGVFQTMEMPKKKIHACMLGNRARVDTSLIGTNKISEEQVNKVARESHLYLNDKIIIDETSGIDPDHVRNNIRYCKAKYGDCEWVVVDYIQRMRLAKSESRVKEVERCALDLADIGREENVIMIELSQISGEYGKKKASGPIYEYYKESQAIIEACDASISLEDPNRGDEFDISIGHKEIKATILQRDGHSDVVVRFAAELQYSKFLQLTDEGWE